MQTKLPHQKCQAKIDTATVQYILDRGSELAYSLFVKHHRELTRLTCNLGSFSRQLLASKPRHVGMFLCQPSCHKHCKSTIIIIIIINNTELTSTCFEWQKYVVLGFEKFAPHSPCTFLLPTISNNYLRQGQGCGRFCCSPSPLLSCVFRPSRHLARVAISF